MSEVFLKGVMICSCISIMFSLDLPDAKPTFDTKMDLGVSYDFDVGQWASPLWLAGFQQ